MRILITSYDLRQHGGAQLYVRDLATSLLSRGHQPLVYSPALGSVADELAKTGVRVTDNLASIELPPDLIHGNQQVETMTALLFFPGTPAVYFCHSARNWMEAPPIFPRILRYVAVDDVCYHRLTDEHGIKPAQAAVILNFVDLERFKPRGPLPDKPRRALVFSNYAHNGTHLSVVRAACKRAAIELEVIGESAGHLETLPESKIGQYDLVFAKARAALEALAVGTAVVLCDTAGLGPMVTTGELDSLRRLNFGFRTLGGPLTVEAVEQQIARYDRRDAASVSERIRATAGSVAAIDQIVELYAEVICEWQRCAVSAEDEGRAAAHYVRQLYDDFAFHGAFTMRWRKRLLRIPLVGPRIVAWRERSSPNQSAKS